MGVLSAALGQWEARDDSKPQAQVRQAANRAMDIIDKMLAELHQLRSRLTAEIRASDDATAARVDAMLVGMRQEMEISHEILGLTFDAGYAAAQASRPERDRKPLSGHLRAVK